MLVMVREDMFAHKIVAMQERMGKTNRDIFDVWFFLKNNWPINKEMIEKRSGPTFEKFLDKCVEDLKKINNQDILAGIGELLDEKQKSWTKDNLIKDTIFLLRLKLENN